jgi:hypothetical protein
MVKIINNCSKYINWDNVIEKISTIPGKNSYKGFVNEKEPEIVDLINSWKNWNNESIEWINFYPEDFGIDIVDVFSVLVDKECCRAWISKINPGKSAPWHWDWDSNETEYLKKGDLIRYHCSITDPQIGHVFIVKDTALYRSKKGDIYEWENYKDFHAGTNCGLVPKYNFNFLGYK